MKFMHKAQSIKSLCRLFGKTPQAYYKAGKNRIKKEHQDEKVVSFVRQERKLQPKIGVLKLQYMINQSDIGLTIGRDALYNLLRSNNLLIRKTLKYRPKQTNGNGESIYPDLRKGLVISRTNQLWSTDITYVELKNSNRFCYLCCICDEASHLIVGHSISLRMRTIDILSGLDQAVKNQLPKNCENFGESLIIHSDRGSQFKSKLFQEFSDNYGIKRSMTKAGHSHENPVAERLNGILKNELLVNKKFNTFSEANSAISKAIKIYNYRRPHLSCNMMTPKQAHINKTWPLKKLWKQRTKFKQSTFVSN